MPTKHPGTFDRAYPAPRGTKTVLTPQAVLRSASNFGFTSEQVDTAVWSLRKLSTVRGTLAQPPQYHYWDLAVIRANCWRPTLERISLTPCDAPMGRLTCRMH